MSEPSFFLNPRNFFNDPAVKRMSAEEQGLYLLQAVQACSTNPVCITKKYPFITANNVDEV